MGHSKKKILVILVAGIGDLVLASKSIRSLRNGYPQSEIHLLTNAQASSIASNYKYIDHVWSFPIRELRKNKRELLNILKLIYALSKIKFDVILNLYRVDSHLGAIKMGLLFLILNSSVKIGHDSYGFGLFVNKKVLPDIFRKQHFVDAMMDVALLAGGKPDGASIEVFIDEKEKMEQKWGYLFDNPTVGINPGGDRTNRRWSSDHYAEVANHLIEEEGVHIILLGGPSEEIIAGEIQSKMNHYVTNLSGLLTLNELIYIISRLHLIITNDSGPMHFAAAVKTHLVALFGPEDPLLFGPYTSNELFRIVFANMDCRPCQRENCGMPLCLEKISPHEVLEKSKDLLNIREQG